MCKPWSCIAFTLAGLLVFKSGKDSRPRGILWDLLRCRLRCSVEPLSLPPSRCKLRFWLYVHDLLRRGEEDIPLHLSGVGWRCRHQRVDGVRRKFNRCPGAALQVRMDGRTIYRTRCFVSAPPTTPEPNVKTPRNYWKSWTVAGHRYFRTSKLCSPWKSSWTRKQSIRPWMDFLQSRRNLKNRRDLVRMLEDHCCCG